LEIMRVEANKLLSHFYINPFIYIQRTYNYYRLQEKTCMVERMNNVYGRVN
jgi:hypothetical protein